MEHVKSFNTIGDGENYRRVRDLVKMKPYALLNIAKVQAVYGQALRARLKDEEEEFWVYLPKRFAVGLDDDAINGLNARSGSLHLVFLGCASTYIYSEARVVLISDLNELASLKPV